MDGRNANANLHGSLRPASEGPERQHRNVTVERRELACDVPRAVLITDWHVELTNQLYPVEFGLRCICFGLISERPPSRKTYLCHMSAYTTAGVNESIGNGVGKY